MSKNATMFNNAFVNSGRFLMLPPSTKLLYFYLLKDADDDGIVDGYATIRILNAEITDWTGLVERRFVVLLEEPFLGWLPDYILHNQNMDLRFKKDSNYLKLLAEKCPTAKIQIKVGKGRSDKAIMSVSDYLKKSQQEQLSMTKSSNTGVTPENSGQTQHNKTKANTNKEKITQLNISQQNLIEQKSSSTQQQQHSNVAAVRANTDDEKKFTPPSLQEVESYCKEKNLQINANTFLQEYEKRNWLNRNGQQIKNWKAVLYSYAMTNTATTEKFRESEENTGHSFTTICAFDFFLKIAIDKLHIKADKANSLYEYVARAGMTNDDVLNYYNKATSSNIENPVGWFVQAIKEAY